VAQCCPPRLHSVNEAHLLSRNPKRHHGAAGTHSRRPPAATPPWRSNHYKPPHCRTSHPLLETSTWPPPHLAKLAAAARGSRGAPRPKAEEHHRAAAPPPSRPRDIGLSMRATPHPTPPGRRSTPLLHADARSHAGASQPPRPRRKPALPPRANPPLARHKPGQSAASLPTPPPRRPLRSTWHAGRASETTPPPPSLQVRGLPKPCSGGGEGR